MERRYLVAALAIIATFAVVSRGFRSLERFSLRHAQQLDAMAKLKYETGAAQTLAKIRTHLPSGYSNEAQLLAEMNVPLGSVEARLAEQMAKQKLEAAQCARATALWQADRARHQAMKLHEKMARIGSNMSLDPIAFEVTIPDDVQQQIEINQAALARQIAAQQMRIQIGADQLRASLDSVGSGSADAVAVTESDQDANDNGVRVHCKTKVAWQQAERAARQAARQAAHQMSYAYSYK